MMAHFCLLFFAQVVTLSSAGQVTWWVVVQVPLTSTTDVTKLTRKTVNLEGGSGKTGVSPHLGAAPWARIALNQAATINIGSVLYGYVMMNLYCFKMPEPLCFGHI